MSEDGQEIIDDIFEDESEATSDQLKSLMGLVDRLAEFQAFADEAEATFKEAKKNLRQVAEGMIPELMRDIGVSRIKLPDGREVSTSTIYTGEAKTEEQFKWLEDNGHGSIIKHQITVNLPNSVPPKMVEHMVKQIENEGFEDVSVKRAVHPQTLRGFLREDIEQGKSEVPVDLFKIFPVEKAKVK